MLKWGTLKVNIDGELSIATAGSLIYLAAKETESMRYTGDVPATDYVIQWFTPAPPKH